MENAIFFLIVPKTTVFEFSNFNIGTVIALEKKNCLTARNVQAN